MNEGLTAYDSQGRLVLSNRGHAGDLPEPGRLLTPGAKFEDFLREGVARGVFDIPGGEATDIVSFAEHMNLPATGARTSRSTLGRTAGWLLVSGKRTSDARHGPRPHRTSRG